MGFFLSVLLILPSPLDASSSSATEVLLKIDSPQAQVGGTLHDLAAAPRVIEGTTMVPLRFLSEVFGAEVAWDSLTREITIKSNGSVIYLKSGDTKALIDGTEEVINTVPLIENGTTLVPLRFIAEKMNYFVHYRSEIKEIHIKQLPSPQPRNHDPIAEFTVDKDTVAQGEMVVYHDVSYDPDGDKLVERMWTGKERAFFAPGEYEVSLQVKDNLGAWSKPYTKVIKVTKEVKMDRFTYNLNNPIPGEHMDLSNIQVLDLKQVVPAVTMSREKVMVSNSPEIIKGEGVLFSDILEGQNRLYYHHINGTNKTKYIYLLAVNQGSRPVKLTLQKWGTAGPADPMSVGRAAAYRYLDFDPIGAKFMEIQPGERVILNNGLSNAAAPGQTVHGIFDVKAYDDILFLVAAVDDRRSVDNYKELHELPTEDNHIRGTFSRAKRSLLVSLKEKEPARLIVADGEDDSFMYGKDVQLLRKNKGNYGLVYRITIKSKYRVGVLFSARGGVFGGAGAWNGEAFNLPNRGILQAREGCMIGVVEPGQEKVLEFIPPAGSYLPVNLIFIPF